MATQKDVAKLANVSFITVSRVINRMGNVKEETKSRVEKAIKELNYYPNSIAQGLNSNRIKTLVIQAPIPIQASVEGTSYYRRLLIGIERYCISHDYDVLISAQRGAYKDFDFLKPFYERKADGIIVIASKPPKEQMDSIKDENIPCVVIGDRPTGTDISYVDTENYNGMAMATKFLISNGHKRIAYIKGNAKTQNAKDRFLGFNKAMEENSLTFNPNWIYNGDFTKECGGVALKYFMSLKDRPTAIISSTDLMAIGCYEEAIKSNIRIPQDISIIGFDGHEICSYTNPPLATMYQPLEEMGMEAAKLIINKIENNTTETVQLLLPVTLIKGGSIKDLTRQ